MQNPFTWNALTTMATTDQVFSPLAIVYVVLFGLGFLGSVYLYNDGAKRFAGNPVKRRAIERCAGIAMVVFGVGLFFFGVRILQINPFSFGMPLWLWLSALAALIMAGYFVYYATSVYPVQLRAYEQQRLKQQYLRPGAASALRTAASRTEAGPPRQSGTRPTRKRRR